MHGWQIEEEELRREEDEWREEGRGLVAEGRGSVEEGRDEGRRSVKKQEIKEGG